MAELDERDYPSDDGITVTQAAEPAADGLSTEDTEGSTAPIEDTPSDSGDGSIDYEAIMASDLAELRREFPELSRTSSLTEIKNPLRYAALRDLGLTPTEAYLAARGKAHTDTRSHLSGGVPKPAGVQGGAMPRSELEGARELFYGMSDSEIQRLWRKVTK